MKQVAALVFSIALFFTGCSGPSKFVSQDTGFNITFPCKNAKIGNDFYGCQDMETYVYYVKLNQGGDEEFEKRKAEFAKEVAKSNEEKELRQKVRSNPNAWEDSVFREFQINGQKAIELVSEKFAAHELSKVRKEIYILKDNKMIEVSGSHDKGIKQNTDDYKKLLETQFKPFFESIELK